MTSLAWKQNMKINPTNLNLLVVYISTYVNPLYSTYDLRQIRYTTHPTYSHVVLQLLYRLVVAAPGPLACPYRGARPPSLSLPQRSA